MDRKDSGPHAVFAVFGVARDGAMATREFLLYQGSRGDLPGDGPRTKYSLSLLSFHGL